MIYKSIYTSYALAKLGAAQLTARQLNLTTMAVGDGGGNPTDPQPEHTSLVRERFRASISRVYPNPDQPAQWTAELIIPKSEAGFVIREVAVIDDELGVCILANLPDTTKPHESEGAFADTVIRVDFVVANADLINIILDPNVIVASQTWVLNAVTAELIIPGGTTGQTLQKRSNDDGDVAWGDPDTANVVVDVIEERQTLAADQTTIDFSLVTTRGLAVYIDGERINKGVLADEWDVSDTTPNTSIELGQSYPAGTKLLAVQNNPNGSLVATLARDANLSDVPDKAAARNHLDIHSRAESNAAGQAGDIKYTTAASAPAGWLKANGAAISRTVYDALFAAIGTRFGSGDGFTTFNLPDVRGEFIRAWDDGRGVDGGRELGSIQGHSYQSHTHGGSSESAGNHTHSGAAQSAGGHSHNASTVQAGEHSHALNPNSSYSTHDSPDNLAVRYLMADPKSSTLRQAVPEINANNYILADGGHVHAVSVGTGGTHSHAVTVDAGGTHSHVVTISPSGGAETRPRNIAFLALIKY